MPRACGRVGAVCVKCDNCDIVISSAYPLPSGETVSQCVFEQIVDVWTPSGTMPRACGLVGAVRVKCDDCDIAILSAYPHLSEGTTTYKQGMDEINEET